MYLKRDLAASLLVVARNIDMQSVPRVDLCVMVLKVVDVSFHPSGLFTFF